MILPKNQHTVGMKGSQEVKLPRTNIQLANRFANLFTEQIPAHLKIRRSSFVKEALPSSPPVPVVGFGREGKRIWKQSFEVKLEVN